MRYTGPRQMTTIGPPTPIPVWVPERSYDGLTVVLIGGGPSHADIDLDMLKGRCFIAINSGCRKVRPIATEYDMLYFSDNSWNENRPELAMDWPGPVVTCNSNTKARLGGAVRRIDITALTMEMGIMPDHVQASSGHIAACLAAVMGAARIVLIGFECQAVGGRTHGHSDYSDQDHNHFRERFLPGWRGLAHAFAHRGVEVLQATPHSALTEFEFCDFATALR